jgi:hypothetical protein
LSIQYGRKPMPDITKLSIVAINCRVVHGGTHWRRHKRSVRRQIICVSFFLIIYIISIVSDFTE